MCCRSKDHAGLSSYGGDSIRCAQILVLGEVGVGKTTLLRRFIGEPFVPETIATIGVDFFMMDIYIDDGPFKIQLWDTSGQEMFHALTKSFYRRAAAVIMVYEERKRSTLNQLRDFWIPQLLENGCPATHLLVVGNKCDTLRPGKERVSDTILNAMCTGYETTVCHLSAKDDNQGVLDEIMDDFCKRVLIHKFNLGGTLDDSDNPITSIRLNDENS